MTATKDAKPLKDNDYYVTPPEVWGPILQWLGLTEFALDPCSPMERKPYVVPAARLYTEEHNGLIQPWVDVDAVKTSPGQAQHVWVNPPYSQYEEWVKKAIQESRKGAFVWMLLNQSNANVWQDLINPQMQFKIALRSRVKFILNDKPMANPRYDNYLVHFGPDERYRNQLRSQPHVFPLAGEAILDIRKVGGVCWGEG